MATQNEQTPTGSQKTRHDYKDRVFCKLFGSEEYKDYLLSLYNALNGTDYRNPDDVQINPKTL